MNQAIKKIGALLIKRILDFSMMIHKMMQMIGISTLPWTKRVN